MEFVGLFLDKSNERPLYEQLYAGLIGEIRAGRIRPGEKLPGKRSAAAQLGISVNTVDEAYQMLAAEGYLEARPRSGFVVNRLERQHTAPRAEAHGGEAAEKWVPEEANWKYSFSTAGIDMSLFPRKMWTRLFREVLSGDDSLFARGAPYGEDSLRSAIGEYLRGYRGVRCEAGQIVVGAGLEVLVGMLMRLLAAEVVAVEDPGYPKTSQILQNMGVEVRRLPVDGGGLPPDLLLKSGARVAYLTPSHQFPTGAVMPVGRREALLQWASEVDGLLVEDDYDSEFRFDGRPLPSLQGLDAGGHVVYAGTFSRSLAPGIRAAYLVLPHRLMSRWQSAYGDYACTISRPEQQTLARMLGEGHFARSLNRMRVAYRRRRNRLLEQLGGLLGEIPHSFINAHTGLYCLLRLEGLDALAIAENAREAGLRVRSLESYLASGGTHTAPEGMAPKEMLVLGYGGLEDEAVDGAAGALAEVIHRCAGQGTY